MAEDYEGMTVAELKALLKEQGLPVSGKKSRFNREIIWSPRRSFRTRR